ncbi:AraC family transcriptional regulator [Duffyella gerundensis]|jgi:AraC-like DNA-binding protein|uniref:AraC family transcriptional regulator n=1 Tax=Duffyella gerundensis TaxID=1619313 RepID=UPI0016541228|nr:AraC family transcriptional regulator [Duffyella gerundensis]UCB29770.1 AraC family transcriptional regulator [Duffyella gerundensis]
MNVVPAQFPCEKDRAQFRQLAGLSGVELYHAHISRYAFEPHTHEAFGIGTIDAGVQRFRYRGTSYLAPADSLIMMNPDELHTGESACDQGWRYRMIYLQPAMLEQLTGESGWWFSEVMHHDIRLAQQVAQLVSQMWHSESTLAGQGTLLQLIDTLRPQARIGNPLRREAGHRFDIVRDYLREHYAENVTLEQLAQLVALSPWHFQRAFRQHYHVTPHQMLMAFRLYEAKLRLACGHAAAQVALEVGLSDQAHLTRCFAHRYGITPVRYQKQMLLTR